MSARKKEEKTHKGFSHFISIWQLASFPSKLVEQYVVQAAELRESNVWHICAQSSSDQFTLCSPCARLLPACFTSNRIRDMNSLTKSRSNVIFNIMACYSLMNTYDLWTGFEKAVDETKKHEGHFCTAQKVTHWWSIWVLKKCKMSKLIN